ncbi:MAG: CdaR family protein [Chloroflexota bacterium]|nr:CdaR family protein [Chloroflexota bacterium]MDQ5865880.1 CdaR family protein [Chloroflexota bacterium]
MKAERLRRSTRRNTPPADDDAILDAAVASVRTQHQPGASETEDLQDTGGDGNVARVDSAPHGVTGNGAVSRPEAVVAFEPAVVDTADGVTRIIDTTTAPGPTGTRGMTWRERLTAGELDERLGRLGLALILAVLLWFYVVNLENPAQTTPFDLTLDVRGTPPNLRLISPLPIVDVTIQAPENIMRNLSPEDVRLYIDLSEMSEGVHEVPIIIETSGLPRDSLTINIDPREVQVQLQLQVTRVFSIAVEVEGTPPLGYKFDPAQVTPRSVEVTGPQDALDRISRVLVPVNIEGQTSRVQGSRNPRALDAEGRDVTGVTFEPATVQVLVPIETYVRSKSVGVLPSVLGQPAAGYRVVLLTADPNNVQICCTEEALGPVDNLNVVPVPITGTTSTIITTTQLILPAGVDLLPTQSREITITVQVEEFQSAIALSVAPVAQGVPPGYSAFVSPERVDVTLQGSINRLQQIAPENVRVVANVSGLGAGAHQVSLQTILPEGVTLQSISADRVTVTLVAPTPTVVPPTATTQPSPTATNEPTVGPTVTQPVVAPPATSTPAGGATATPPVAAATRTPTATPTQAVPTPTANADAPLPTASATPGVGTTGAETPQPPAVP